MKNVYLDSNVWLSMYHFSNDDLEQFSKLKEEVGKSIRLLIPVQTRDEVLRNRDAKLNEALTGLEKLEVRFPTFSKAYPEYSSVSSKLKELKNELAKWIAKIKKDIGERELRADRVIDDFFEESNLLECNEEIVRAAELRYRAGNPPGKDNKLGDAINWECLLKNVNEREDLYLISADKDYKSVIDDEAINLFLKSEWEREKKGSIHYYKSLATFLKQHVKDIELIHEQEKDQLIAALSRSWNFANTHAIIKQLAKYSDWTSSQKADLIAAALDNFQVRWIIQDEDVLAFYKRIVAENINDVDRANDFLALLGEDATNEIEQGINWNALDPNSIKPEDLPF